MSDENVKFNEYLNHEADKIIQQIIQSRRIRHGKDDYMFKTVRKNHATIRNYRANLTPEQRIIDDQIQQQVQNYMNSDNWNSYIQQRSEAWEKITTEKQQEYLQQQKAQQQQQQQQSRYTDGTTSTNCCEHCGLHKRPA